MNCSYFLSDNILVSVAYYIGTEKKYDGILPMGIVAFVMAACVLMSEVIARMKRKKISPAQPNNSNTVISNLIPFTKFNVIFTFSIIVSTVIRIFQKTKIGVPNLSIHVTVMLVCLAVTNSQAKDHFKRRLASWIGEHWELDQPARNPRVKLHRTISTTAAPQPFNHLRLETTTLELLTV